MSGAGIQLAATAPQDRYLFTSDSEMVSQGISQSFFTPGYLQYGEWDSSVEEVLFQNSALDFGKTSVVNIPHRGDLLGESYLEVTLPALGLPGRWVDAVGYVMLEAVMLQLDATVLHGHSIQATDVFNRLLLPQNKREAIEELVCKGRVLSLMEEHVLYIPFDWFFTNVSSRIQTKLPLCGMPSSVLQLQLTIKPLADLVLLDDVTVRVLPAVSLIEPVLLMRYYKITKQERAAQANCTVLVQQIQETQAVNYKIDSTDMTQTVQGLLSIPLPFTRDTAHISWVAQDEYDSEGLNYVDVVSNVSLTFSSINRFGGRSQNYFSHVQRFDFCGRVDSEPIGFYSFGLDASNHQPSGACHFGLTPDPVLKISFDQADKSEGEYEPVVVRVFASTQNELIIKNNRGSLRYA